MLLQQEIKLRLDGLKRAVKEAMSNEEVKAYMELANRFINLKTMGLSFDDYTREVNECILN